MKLRILFCCIVVLLSGLLTHAQDVGVFRILAPSSGCVLAANETVTIRVRNYGGASIILPFNVSYKINGGAAVTESLSSISILSPFTSGDSITYSFSTKANLAVPGTYIIESYSSNGGDGNASNDTLTTPIISSATTVGGSISGSTTVCNSGNSGTLILSGHTGSVVQWEYSTDSGSNWNTISNTTTAQNYSNLTVTTIYRALIKNGYCSSTYSSVATITVDQSTVGGTLAGSTNVCVSSNSGNVSLSGHVGNVTGWEYSTNGGGVWQAIANTTVTQSYLNLSQSTQYRAIVKSGTCASANSSVASVTVDASSVGGAVSGDATVCASSNSGNVSLSGNNGTVTGWEYSTNGGSSWNSIANTTLTESYTNLGITTQYRALVQNGSCSVANSSIATITVDAPSVGGAVSGDVAVCASANNGSVTLSGYTGSVTGWEYSANGGSSWSPIVNTTTTQTFNNLNVSTSYRAIIQNGVCLATNSSDATVTVDQPSIGGTVSGSTHVCINSNSGSVSLSGYTGNVIGWEYSSDSGASWTPIPNTTVTQSYNNIGTETQYRAIVQNGSCASDNSSIAIVTIDSASLGGTVSGSTTVCAFSNNGNVMLTGYTGSIIGWEYSTNSGSSWTAIVNSTSLQAYSGLASTTDYRAIVQSGACASVNSSNATITVLPQSVGGSVSGSTIVCAASNSGTLILSGNSGSVINWESSADGGASWMPISNTTTALNYTNLSQTTRYRAVVMNGACSSAVSSVAIVTVDPTTVGGTIFGSQTVCSGTNGGMLSLSGQSGSILRWEYSTNGGVNWNTIANTTNSHSYSNLNSTTSYRALVQSGSCSALYSSIATVTIDPSPASVGGVISGSDTVCSSVNSGTLTLTNYVGNILKWQEYATNGWVDLSNATSTQSYSNLLVTTKYRAIVQSGSCSVDTSSVAVILIDSLAAGYVSSDTTVCASANGVLTLKGYSGFISDWEISTNGGGTWIPLSANNSASQPYSNITITTLFRATVYNNSCPVPVKSIPATITIFPSTASGTISSGNSHVCSGTNTGLLKLINYTGNMLSWEQSIDSGSNWVSINDSTASFQYVNLTTTTWYRVLVKSGVCPLLISDTVVVNVDEPTVPGSIVNNDTIVCASLNADTLNLSGFTGSITRWERSTDGGGTWINLSNMSSLQAYKNLAISSLFRVLVVNGVCPQKYSDTVSVTVNPGTVAGIVNKDAVLCSGSNNGILNVTGVTGTILNWESSVDGGLSWDTLTNTASTQSYLNLSNTTWFRASVKSGVCAVKKSVEARLTVDSSPPSVGGVLSSSDTVCSGSNDGLISLNGHTGSVVRWEYSVDGGSLWTTTSNNSTSQTYHNLTQTTSYRAVAQSGVCSSASSSVVTIKVDDLSKGGFVSDNLSVCGVLNTGTLELKNYSGTILKWQKEVSGVWTDIINLNFYYSYTNLPITTSFRTIVQNGVCSADTSQYATITVNPLPIASFSVQYVCIGKINSFVNNTSGNIKETFWDFGDSKNSFTENPQHTYDASGDYNVSLVVTSVDGCKDTLVVPVKVNNLPSAKITSSGSLQFCKGGAVSLNAPPGLLYQWSNGASQQSTSVSVSGNYMVIVTDNATGCVNRDSLQVQVFDLPVVGVDGSTTISLGSTTGLTATGGVAYAWLPVEFITTNSNLSAVMVGPRTTTNYTVTVTDNNLCSNTASVTVFVVADYNINVSNALTPNGDGKNDTWYIENIQNYQNNEVRVFNRYGQEVYYAEGYMNNWDGRFNGTVLPDGAYYYVINFRGTDRFIKGTVNILTGR